MRAFQWTCNENKWAIDIQLRPSIAVKHGVATRETKNSFRIRAVDGCARPLN